MGKIAEVNNLPVKQFFNILTKNKPELFVNDCIPPGGFQTISEYFTRAIKPNTRQIDLSSNTIISPCDGKIVGQGVISNKEISIKDHKISLDNLLGMDDSNELNLENGNFAIIYLNPLNYHRFVSPVEGKIESVKYCFGTLLPVNKLGWMISSKVLETNERAIVKIKSIDNFDLYMTIIAAWGVGGIELNFVSIHEIIRREGKIKFNPSININKGKEIGLFNLGSTIVLLWSKSNTNLYREINDKINLGDKIGDY